MQMEIAPPTKDTSKTPYTLVDFEFIAAMARNMQVGLEQDSRRKPGDWKQIEWTEDAARHYRDALLRHAVENEDWAAVACNAMIIAHHEK